MKKRIKIQRTLILLAVIFTILLSEIVLPRWGTETFDEFLDVLGICLVLLGFLFRISARGHKEENSGEGTKLVKDGPYFLMRHPMYFGTLLIGTGIVFVALEIWTLILFLAVFLFIYIPQIQREEKALSKRFGNEYDDYCKTVPRYFPRMNVEVGNRLILKSSWFKKEFLSFIAVVGAILGVEIWEDIEAFGYRAFPKEFLELLVIMGAFFMIIVFLRKRTAAAKEKEVR
jgi:protein-S-isoprenylcysteine O-methyltransferase Ste14